MLISVKEGVVFKEINDHLLAMLAAAYVAFSHAGYLTTVTSATDGIHIPKSGRPSLHYKSLALDFRVKLIPTSAEVRSIMSAMKEELGPDYDLVYEDPGGPNSHLHVEFQPKGIKP